MSYRYRCTGAAVDLAVCRRTLGALKYIYDIGAESEEPGFLTKPYGGVASTQTSGDQRQLGTGVNLPSRAVRGLAGNR